MRILVLGGSPKGETSVTMQYVRWIRESLRGHEVETIQIASRIAAIERDRAEFDKVLVAVRGADAILWAFPLYVFTVCSQYKRFIELVWERSSEGAFAGKYAASLSTSIHFFDNVAHDYIRAVSEDLGMRFTGYFSPRMEDLRKLESRRQLELFAEGLAAAAEGRLSLPRRNAPLPVLEAPRASERPSDILPVAGAAGKKVLVLVDYPELAIGAMARRFAAAARAAGAQAELLPLEAMGMRGGCLGCLKCGQANHCAYEGKDGFIEAFRSKVMSADLLIYAGTVRDRLLSSRWKAFLDRGFFNTHQQVLTGKQFVYLVAGPLTRLDALRQSLQAYVEWQGGNLIDMISDEVSTSEELDSLIDDGSRRAARALAAAEARPATFLGVGGMKIFRDDIFGPLRVVFKADHRAFKRTGVYGDIPTRKPLERAAVFLGYWITSIPKVYRGMISNFPAFMIKNFETVFAAVPDKRREAAKESARAGRRSKVA
jgi:multimeric flavodoxin WrbA